MFVERALKDLNLNDKEKAKVEDVLKAHREKVQKAAEAVRADYEKATKGVTDKDKLAEARKVQGEKMKKTFESLRGPAQVDEGRAHGRPVREVREGAAVGPARPGRPPRLLRAEAEGQGNEVIVSTDGKSNLSKPRP